MEDTVIVYRPHKDIEKSVETLSHRDLHLVGRLNLSLIIKTILGGLDLIEYPTRLIESNWSVWYYWNDGNPYLNDLLYYYDYADELWMNSGGLGYDYLKDCREVVENCDHIDNEAPWSEEMSNIHKLLLLERDRQWYKRKFLNIRTRKLKDPNPFTPTGKPRSVKTRKIQLATKEIQDV